MIVRFTPSIVATGALLLLASCKEPTKHEALPADAQPRLAPSGSNGAAGSAAGPAAPPADVIASGPCQGKKPGASACDGQKLVKCDDLAGKVTEVQTCFSIEKCDAEKAECAPACPSGEVYVPATGPKGFTMGRGREPFGFGSRASGIKGTGIADTPHNVVLTKPFCMDENEATVGEYRACVVAKVCTPPDIRSVFNHYRMAADDFPVNMTDWKQAVTFCKTKEKTLPTEAQWEWAASGGDGREWPWGNETPTCEHADFSPGPLPEPACDCGCGGGGGSKVGSHPKGDKVWPAGRIHDLAGNVWEWTLDNYWRFKADPAVDPLYKTDELSPHVVRGGGWNRSGIGITVWFRGAAVVNYQRPGLGFRCMRNPA